MKKEIWRSIKGYEGLYEVSNCGNVRSVDRIVTYSDGRKRLWKGHFLKLVLRANGYLMCCLSRNGRSVNELIHRLVAQAFIHNPNNLPVINHKDENKTNNHVSNLEWCTTKYNINYGTGIQRSAEKKLKPVLQIDKETNEVIAEYYSLKEASIRTRFHKANISACCREQIKTAYGFKWKYKE